MSGRRLASLFAVACLCALGLAAGARAQPPSYGQPPYAPAPTYTAQPPTKGALYRDGQTGRYLLGGTWLYRPDYDNVGLLQRWWRDVASTVGWEELTVPNAYNAGDYSTTSWNGWVGWYRRDFTVPAGAFAPYVPPVDRHWIIRFESVDYTATVWLNGRLVGGNVGENLPFELDLNGVHAGVNRLIVRVNNRRQPSDIPPGSGGGWWNFGGILREVYLRAVQRADISQVQIQHAGLMSRRPAEDHRSAWRRSRSRRSCATLPGRSRTSSSRACTGGTAHLREREIAPHATWTAQASVQIADPDLWSIDHPALYRATLTLSDALGRPLGGYLTDSGIRTITVTPGGGLELNGRLLNLRGVEIREQNLQTGAALTPPQLAQLVEWVKELGATVIRADPLNPQIEELADRDGILIWSDIPSTSRSRRPSSPSRRSSRAPARC